MKYLCSLFLILFCQQSYSQGLENVWINLNAGVTNYQGDLQDVSYLFNNAHFAGGLGVQYEINDHFEGRFRMLFGKISGNDQNTMNQKRNLRFASGISEFQLGAQYNIFSLNERKVTPYLFVAVALYHFNPYTFDTAGAKFYLPPLSTEGEGIVDGVDPYKQTQISIPMGGGVTFALNENIRVGLEIGARKTFTNYLDDVGGRYVDESLLLAERGPKAVELAFRTGEIDPAAVYPDGGSLRSYSKLNDWYYYTGINFSFRLKRDESMNSMQRRWRKKNNFSDCPKL